MPSNFIIEGNIDFKESDAAQDDNNIKETKENKEVLKKNSSDKTNAQMSWLSLFAELDPLANQDIGDTNGDTA